MSEAEDTPQKYGIWDTKEKSMVPNKEYNSLKSALKGVDRLDNQYGGYRYTTKELPPVSGGAGGGGGGVGGGGRAGGGGGASINLGGKLGRSTSLETPIKQAKGGVVSASRRGDGIAQRGKTRGKTC